MLIYYIIMFRLIGRNGRFFRLQSFDHVSHEWPKEFAGGLGSQYRGKEYPIDSFLLHVHGKHHESPEEEIWVNPSVCCGFKPGANSILLTILAGLCCDEMSKGLNHSPMRKKGLDKITASTTAPEADFSRTHIDCSSLISPQIHYILF